MFLVGLCIHFVFLLSIFDIYFKSPIVKDVRLYKPLHNAVADRMVLFVVDGLRAESFVNFTTMEKLRHTATFDGKWGISNTRVPTESRPGHVALIAGFYEDPSAVLRGWKENPVDFDSVFNQTKNTWGWGTYDIVEIFTKGANDEHIIMNKFDPYDQLLRLSQNTTLLDAWVFEHVKEFFHKAKADKVLHDKLMEKKIVFFLHLLGTDTSGHTHKPNTENYLTTLNFADNGIKEIENIVRDFYNDDGRTTFLMTSDHGMTDWGSHGAGDYHETETPFVIWGAGINALSQEEATTFDGKLPTKNKFIVNQADFAPLMSTILSIPVPVNSVGELPLELLDISLEDKSKALFSNSKQLSNQYNKKRTDVEAHATKLLYQPFEHLTSFKYQELIGITERLLENEKYDKVIDLSKEIMRLSLSGLQYYHNYYQRPLLASVTLSFLGWIAFLLKTLLVQSFSVQENKPKRLRTHSNCVVNIKAVIFFVWTALSIYLVWAQNLPSQYYIYFLLPVSLWWYALTPFEIWMQCLKKYIQKDGCTVLITDTLCYSVGVLTMGLSFTYRWMLSVPLCGMALWPVLSTTRHGLSDKSLALWSCTCCLLSAFTFMPVVGKQVYIPYVIIAGLIWLSIHVLCTWKLFNNIIDANERTKEIFLNAFQAILLGSALYNVFIQSRIYDEGLPHSKFYQAMAWIITIISLVQPLLHTKRLICRLLAINTSIFTLYILLSVIQEGLFLVTLAVNATCWVFIEFKKSHPNSAKILDFVYDKSERSILNSIAEVDRSVNREDFRRAFFCFKQLLYIIVSFFGTGNIASMNSFEWRWVACFVSSFHPFLISALVLFKTLCPFLCVASCFRAVQHLTKAPTGYLNVIVLIYSNIMGIQLLYNVKNTGSWLDIGTSISQFVIVQVITLFIVLINQLAILLSDYSIFIFFSNMFQSNKKNL